MNAASFRRLAPLILASIICALGSLWAFERGAPDFSVFLHAAELVRAGRSAEIYVNSPDRYLYAPAFAWLFLPFTYLPRALALAIWCALKWAALGWMARSVLAGSSREKIYWVLGWGVLVVARPLLIEFQYGQVNLLVIAAILSALCLEVGAYPRTRALTWFVATLAALTKLMALPVLAIPLLVRAIRGKSQLPEMSGIVVGFCTLFLLPTLAIGPARTLDLHAAWREAIVAKGFPLESHNQSMAATIERLFSGAPTHVIGLGPEPISMTVTVISEVRRQLLTLAWSFFALGILAFGLIGFARAPNALRAAWIIAALYLPLYLLWKPYFVAELPLVMVLVASAPVLVRNWGLIILFVLNNLTSTDIVGRYFGPRMEAASILFFGLAALVIYTARLGAESAVITANNDYPRRR